MRRRQAAAPNSRCRSHTLTLFIITSSSMSAIHRRRQAAAPNPRCRSHTLTLVVLISNSMSAVHGAGFKELTFYPPPQPRRAAFRLHN